MYNFENKLIIKKILNILDHKRYNFYDKDDLELKNSLTKDLDLKQKHVDYIVNKLNKIFEIDMKEKEFDLEIINVTVGYLCCNVNKYYELKQLLNILNKENMNYGKLKELKYDDSLLEDLILDSLDILKLEMVFEENDLSSDISFDNITTVKELIKKIKEIKNGR